MRKLTTRSRLRRYRQIVGAKQLREESSILDLAGRLPVSVQNKANCPFKRIFSVGHTADGADEIAPGLALIKGGGGKLLREKIVASASKRFVVVADESKQVQKLGRFPLPVEAIPMAAPLSGSFRGLGFMPSLRAGHDGRPYITDEGNFILDGSGLLIENPDAVAAEIDSIVGAVERGLFLHVADLAVIADEKQVIGRKV